MTKTEKIVGLKRAQGESVSSFREKVDCVMAEWGYTRGPDLDEQEGAVQIHTYRGDHGQFISHKFVAGESENSYLKWDKNGGPEDRFDSFVVLNEVPKTVAEGLVKDLSRYDEPKKSEKPSEGYTGEIPEILGINKATGESRRDFRRRLNEFLTHYGFENVESEPSDDGDFLYKIYEGNGGEMVEATFAGDNIADTHGFDYETQEMFLPYAEDSSHSLVDAALIFEGLAPEIKDRLYSELEQKFIVE